MTPQVGQYGVVRTSGFLGLLIRLGTKSQVNHAFIVMDGGNIVEAKIGGAVLSPLSDYDGRLVIYNDQEPLTRAQTDQICKVALTYAKVGIGYSFYDIFVLALTCFGVRWKWAAKRVERSNRLICSQLVDRAYMSAGVHLFDDGRLSGSVSPGDLLLRLAMHAWTLTSGDK